MRALLPLLLVVACAPAASVNTPPAPRADVAPWLGASLQPSDVGPVFASAWRAAQNRTTCALLAPRTPGDAGAASVDEATPRAATFAGGWGVAYDLPETRSAFGVAGTGARANEPGTFDQWPHSRTWADGSRVGYGPEGGTGTNQLAYLTIPGQGCLYNVWSRIGRAHLESLLEQLRFVEMR